MAMLFTINRCLAGPEGFHSVAPGPENGTQEGV